MNRTAHLVKLIIEYQKLVKQIGILLNHYFVQIYYWFVWPRNKRTKFRYDLFWEILFWWTRIL